MQYVSIDADLGKGPCDQKPLKNKYLFIIFSHSNYWTQYSWKTNLFKTASSSCLIPTADERPTCWKPMLCTDSGSHRKSPTLWILDFTFVQMFLNCSLHQVNIHVSQTLIQFNPYHSSWLAQKETTHGTHPVLYVSTAASKKHISFAEHFISYTYVTILPKESMWKGSFGIHRTFYTGHCVPSYARMHWCIPWCTGQAVNLRPALDEMEIICHELPSLSEVIHFIFMAYNYFQIPSADWFKTTFAFADNLLNKVISTSISPVHTLGNLRVAS